MIGRGLARTLPALAVLLLPALGLTAAAGLCFMHRARPCSGRKPRRDAD